MGFKLYNLCRYRVVGNPLEKAVLMALASYAKDDGSSVYPSKHSLAVQLEYCLRSVQNAVKKLVEKGILKRVGKRPMFMGGSIVYQIDLNALTRLPNADPALTCLDEVAGELCSPQEKGVQEITQRGASGYTKKRRSCTQIINNPINQNTQPHAMGAQNGQERRSTFKTPQGIRRRAANGISRAGRSSAPSQAEHVRAAEQVQAMWVEKIHDGKYVPPSAVSVSQANALILSGAVTARQLDKLGIAFSVPWDRKTA